MKYLDYPGIILIEQAILAIASFSPTLSNLSLHFCYCPWEIESTFDFVVTKISKKAKQRQFDSKINKGTCNIVLLF